MLKCTQHIFLARFDFNLLKLNLKIRVTLAAIVKDNRCVVLLGSFFRVKSRHKNTPLREKRLSDDFCDTFLFCREEFIIFKQPEFTGFIRAKEPFRSFGNFAGTARTFADHLAGLPV